MNLARAIAIAVQAHDGQTDKSGYPYILHPLRVMLALDDDDARIVGVLHDVVEDCPDWSFDRLRNEGFSDRVLHALSLVTKSSDDADYAAFIRRAMPDSIARRVKRADLMDNLNAARLQHVSASDAERMNRYIAALVILDGN